MCRFFLSSARLAILLLCGGIMFGCAASINSTSPNERSETLSEITDQELLARIAQEDMDEDVRRAAVSKLTDQKALVKIALEDEYWGVRLAAVSKLTDQELLAKIAQEDADGNVRGAALKLTNWFRIEDEDFIDKLIPRGYVSNIQFLGGDEESGWEVLGQQVARYNGKWAVWSQGSVHTWIGKSKAYGYAFEGNKDDPLQFRVDLLYGYDWNGYIYVKGRGTVTMPDGRVVKLPR